MAWITALRRLVQPLYSHPVGARVAWRLQRFLNARLDDNLRITIHNFDGDLHFVCAMREHISNTVFWSGYYSPHDLMMLDALFQPTDTFVDVGANQGVFTLFAAKRLTQGQVLAFEPQEENFAMLSGNIALNGFSNVRLFRQGLGNTRESIPIYGPSSHDAFHTLNSSRSSTIPHDTITEPLGSIDVVPLDEVVDEQKVPRVDVLKIDIEGAELFALQGMEKTLERDTPTVHMEVNVPSCKAAGYDAHDLLRFFHDRGYALYFVHTHISRIPPFFYTASLRPLTPDAPLPYPAQNVLCVKRDTHQRALARWIR